MHLAFISHFDPRDVRAWSGIPYYMARGLREHVERLSLVGPLHGGPDIGGRLRGLRERLHGRSYLRQHTRPVLSAYAKEARRHIDALRPDAVLAPSTLPVALLDASPPTAYWCGSTFESNLFTYAEYSNLPDDLVAEAHLLEEEALRRVSVAFFAGEHAARSAVNYYGADASKVHVVPYGPNMDRVPDGRYILEAVEGRPSDHCQLLFIGKDWVRKGGDVAVKVAAALNQRGVSTTLNVVGADPSLGQSYPFVRTVGYLNKTTTEGRQRMHQLLASSHFLILPTRAENFGCVFSEASAYGLPSLTTAVDGVPSAVQDGVNGKLFAARPSPAAIADVILELLSNRGEYIELCRSSRAAFERHLNWGSATRTVVERLEEHIR